MNRADQVALEILTNTVGKDGRKVRPLIDRFHEKHAVDLETGCWEWIASAKTRGYGTVGLKHGHGSILAHRLSYLIHVGEIPDGMELDHLCRNRACVNPEHLEPVTTAENGRRAKPFRTKPTHCPAGHPYAEFGVVFPSGKSFICRACKTEYARRYRATKRKPRLRELTPDQVRAIRAGRAAGRLPRELAIEFGTNETTIGRIMQGRSYASVV